jgi:hypothetical protein
MSARPSIPIDIQREVLFEARHRCAVCCEPTPLERAHIVAWSKSRDHAATNLIALCANCHTRADNELWGAEYLRMVAAFAGAQIGDIKILSVTRVNSSLLRLEAPNSVANADSDEAARLITG